MTHAKPGFIFMRQDLGLILARRRNSYKTQATVSSRYWRSPVETHYIWLAGLKGVIAKPNQPPPKELPGV